MNKPNKKTFWMALKRIMKKAKTTKIIPNILIIIGWKINIYKSLLIWVLSITGSLLIVFKFSLNYTASKIFWADSDSSTYLSQNWAWWAYLLGRIKIKGLSLQNKVGRPSSSAVKPKIFVLMLYTIWEQKILRPSYQNAFKL